MTTFNFDLDSFVYDDIKVKDSIKYLFYLNDNHKPIVDDYLAYKCLFYLTRLTHLGYKDLAYFKNHETLLANILLECYKTTDELNFECDFELEFNDITKKLSVNSQRISMLNFALSIVNAFSLKIYSFNINFVKAPTGLESHFIFLKCGNFMQKALNCLVIDFASSLKLSLAMCNLVKQILYNLNLWSRFTNEETLKKWGEFNAVETLIKVANLKEKTFDLIAYLTIMNIAEDKHIETLKSDMSKIIKELVCCFNTFCCELQEKKLIRTQKKLIDPNDQELKKITVYSLQTVNEPTIYFIDILHALQRLALNDKTRLEIFETKPFEVLTSAENGEVNQEQIPETSFNRYLKQLLLAANQIELEFILKLIVQLTFNTHIAFEFEKNNGLVSFLEKHAHPESQQLFRAEIRKLSELILWNLKHSKISNEVHHRSSNLKRASKNENVPEAMRKESTIKDPKPAGSKANPTPTKVAKPAAGQAGKSPAGKGAPKALASGKAAPAAAPKSKPATKENLSASLEPVKSSSPKLEKQSLVHQNSSEHILLSYETVNRDLILKIKNELEIQGFKCVLDSNMDSMNKQVELSQCVLVAISENYRLSAVCQAEAQYAARLKKPIIPLIVQLGYENVKGWLGEIVHNKTNAVNFSKFSFEEAMKQLKFELNILNLNAKNFQQHNADPNQLKSGHLNLTEKSGFNLAAGHYGNFINHWNESQVKDWFLKNNINVNIYNEFFPCEGNVLKQLYDMRRDAPEFYFQSFGKNSNIDIKSVTVFTDLLIKLFT